MNSFGDRLREERERLGFSQEAFGEIGGVRKLAQRNYEKGNRSPDSSYMSAIAAIGADVLYILTGQRAGGVPALSPREEALLDNYRHSDDAGKRAVEGAARAVSQPEGKVANGKR